MNLQQLKAMLAANREKHFRLLLPNRSPVPAAFHVTEVGRVSKTFIDCGGGLHSLVTCQLQTWIGDDAEHRLDAGKLADILNLAAKILPDESVDVEIEYEAELTSQYRIESHSTEGNMLVLQLVAKHTDCLAKEKCMVPTAVKGGPCCGPNCC